VGNILVSLLCARNDRVTIVTRDPEHHRTARAGRRFRTLAAPTCALRRIVHLAANRSRANAGRRSRSACWSRAASIRRFSSSKRWRSAASAARPRQRVGGRLVRRSRRGDVDREFRSAGDFLGSLCVKWESAADTAESLGVARRAPAPRHRARPFRRRAREVGADLQLGLGGPLGPRSSWFPWVYVGDLARFILFAIDDDRLRGSFNAVAPGIVRQGEFARTLGRVLSRPALLPAPKFALKLALGEVANALTGSQRVVPERTLAAGFVFQQPTLEGALKHTLRKA
jgi:NAD dependent epimerase/dehydratase family enzyme